MREIINKLIRDDRTGLMAGFIDQAIYEFAKEVAKADPEQLTRAANGFVSGHAWIGCAKQIIAMREKEIANFLEDEGAAMTKHAVVFKSETVSGRPRMSCAVLSNKVVVRAADRWPCPYCGRALRPTYLKMNDDGVAMICADCHHDVLIIEWPEWPE